MGIGTSLRRRFLPGKLRTKCDQRLNRTIVAHVLFDAIDLVLDVLSELPDPGEARSRKKAVLMIRHAGKDANRYKDIEIDGSMQTLGQGG